MKKHDFYGEKRTACHGRTSNCKTNGHFSTQNHRIFGAILHTISAFSIVFSGQFSTTSAFSIENSILFRHLCCNSQYLPPVGDVTAS